MRPDVTVMLKTAARVMTSHFATQSIGWSFGGLAVSRTYRQAASRSANIGTPRGPIPGRIGTCASTVARIRAGIRRNDMR